MVIKANELKFSELNEKIRTGPEKCRIIGCLGQRFIAAGMDKKSIVIDGIPGNALGAYLSGAVIEVNSNAQDAVGDTMNDGRIIIHGNAGDAAGYAMRGGEIYIRGSAGYRAGIHMKEYKQKKPVIVVGKIAGSFLGEYQAGGIIIVLGLEKGKKSIVGNYPCTGMHGGKMFLRGDVSYVDFPDRVTLHTALAQDIEEIKPYLERFCKLFDYSLNDLLSEPFTVITPDSKNPYKQMYVAN